MNPITNRVISRITKLKKSISRSQSELDQYLKMKKSLETYELRMFGRNTFVISHPTIHYLTGIIKVQQGKLKLLEECLVNTSSKGSI